MAVYEISTIERYMGLSTDTKPTAGVPAGSTFYETDKYDLYLYDGTSAWTKANPNMGSSVAKKLTGSVTRPADATAYAAGDTVSTSTSAPTAIQFANAGVAGQLVMIVAATMRMALSASAPTGNLGYKVHLFDGTPGTLTNDNAAFSVASGDADNYFGFVELGGTPYGAGTTTWLQNSNSAKLVCLLAGTSIYGVVESIGGYTPSSGDTHYITLYCMYM